MQRFVLQLSFCVKRESFFSTFLRLRPFVRKPTLTSHILHESYCTSQCWKSVRCTSLSYPCITFSPAIHRRCKATLPEKLVKCTPMRLQPYLRLIRIDKPTGTLLLLWPCYWSLAMAAPPGSLPDPSLLGLFACGAFLMRGAGCTINDLWDRKIDAKVSRTMNRPFATGELSALDGWMFLGGQLSLSLIVLLQLNWYSIVLGSTSLFMVAIYPLMKRITNYPQLVLGLTFNWGAMLGWSALNGSCDWPIVLPLYGACIFWTMIYDTIYAHQDKTDDLLINIKSTALKFGKDTKLWLRSFALCSTTCFALAGFMDGQTWPFYVSIGVSALVFLNQIQALDIHNPNDCMEKFKSNQRIGLIIFLGIVTGTLLKQVPERTLTKASDCLDNAAFHLT